MKNNFLLINQVKLKLLKIHRDTRTAEQQRAQGKLQNSSVKFSIAFTLFANLEINQNLFEINEKLNNNAVEAKLL